MLNKMTGDLDFHAKALVLRSQRQQLIASNIANADTPGFVARDLNFKEAMGNAMAQGSSMAAAVTPSTTHAGHIALGGLSTSTMQFGGRTASSYAVQSQPSADNNSVDMDRERANFVDNTVRYEATLRFINGDAKTMLAAIQGQ